MEEASEHPLFDLENTVAAGPVEDWLSANSNLHKEVRVSGDNISLYVEFRSPECEIMHATSGEVGNAKNMVVAIGDEVSKFAVGDVVWVKTKTKIWWPGKIHHPSDASKYGVKADPGNCLLVRYLANSHVAWYNPSQLKPFYENFMQMSRQNKSKGFVAAIEKAVDEFGIHIKSRLTSSSCTQATGPPGSNGVESDKAFVMGDFGEISVTLLDSRNFVSHLKNLALAVSKPRVLEPAILTGYLSAFYCSFGHLNLPMNLLRPMANAENAASGLGADPSAKSKNVSGKAIGSDKVIEDIPKNEIVKIGPESKSKSRKKKRGADSVVRDGSEKKVEGLDGPITRVEEGSGPGLSEKGSDSRARKKSKYLTYPYIILEGKGLPTEVDNAQIGLSGSQDELLGSPPVAKPSSKFVDKWLKILNDISAEVSLNVPSIEFLSGLRLAASGYLYPDPGENLERVAGFFYKFRGSSFCGDASIDEMCGKNVIAEIKRENERAAEPDEGRKKEKSGNENLESPLVETEDKGWELEGKELPHISSGVNIGIATPLHLPIKDPSRLPDLNDDGNSAARSDFSGKGVLPVFVGCAGGDLAKKKRKRKKKEMPEIGNAAQSPVLIPDLNGTQTSPNQLCKESQGPSAGPAEVDSRQRRRRQTRGTPIALTFSQGNPVPPKEVLEAEFSKFGPLKAVVAPSPEDPQVARVVFERKKEATKAHRSLEKGNPFGGALVKFELQDLVPSKAFQNLTMRTALFTNGALISPHANPTGSAARTGQPKAPIPALAPVLAPAHFPSLAGTPAPAPAPAGAPAPPLDRIKQNLEMMTSMLKQSGDNLSPETKAKLELEIKGLLSKVSTMVCSSSSS